MSVWKSGPHPFHGHTNPPVQHKRENAHRGLPLLSQYTWPALSYILPWQLQVTNILHNEIPLNANFQELSKISFLKVKKACLCFLCFRKLKCMHGAFVLFHCWLANSNSIFVDKLHKVIPLVQSDSFEIRNYDYVKTTIAICYSNSLVWERHHNTHQISIFRIVYK